MQDPRAVYRFPLLAVLFLLPTLAILVFFLYYPTIQTFALSVYQIGFLGLTQRFVGLKNYLTIFTDPATQRVLQNTLIFSAGSVLGSMSLGLGLALLAGRKIRGWRIYRLLLIWPYAMSPAVAGAIFLFLFNSQSGLINYFLSITLHIKPSWLANPVLAMLVIIMAAVWQNLGYNVVFYLAALQGLPGDVLEAAIIDGATAWQRFWKITFPLLSPMTFFLLITNSIIAFFGAFALVDMLTKGGPAGATNILIYSIYQNGFEFFKTGYAAALSVLLFFIVVILTIIQFRFTGRRVHYGG